MPGIEGDEGKVKKEIWKAVSEAHIVFYVHSSSKEPEEGTIKKIKKYLRKNAEVYSILNLRGIFPPEVFKQQKEVASRIKLRTDEKLKKILGESYQNSFLVHALFGFFGKAKSIPPHLNRQYNKAIKLYKSKERLLEVSNLEDLIKFLESFNKEYKEYKIKILWGNFRKILRTQEEIISSLLRWKADFDKKIKEMYQEIDKFKYKLEREKKLLEDNIKRIIDLEASTLRRYLQDEIFKAIDNEYSQSYIRNAINKKTKQFQLNLEKKLKKEINDFKEKLLKDLETLRKKIGLIARKTEVDVDIQSILNKLEYTLEEIFKEVGDVIFSIASTIAAFLIHPILGIIVGIINIIRKIWDWFFSNPKKKKENAKIEARRKIEEAIGQVKEDINRHLKQVYKEINKQFFQALKEIKYINNQFKSISRHLDPVIAELIKSNARMSLIFLQELDPNTKFGYIQTNLKSGTHIAAVTDTPEVLRKKLEYLNINLNHIYLFKSLNDLKSYLNYQDNENNEFLKRLKRLIENLEMEEKLKT